MAKVLQMYEYSKGKSLPVGGKSLLLRQKRFSTAVKWHFSRRKEEFTTTKIISTVICYVGVAKVTLWHRFLTSLT